jgi:hypothetical protein
LLDTAEEEISELEHMSIEIYQTEKQREKRIKRKQMKIIKNHGTITKVVSMHIICILEK